MSSDMEAQNFDTDPYAPTELETVQGATIGSAAVKYNDASEEDIGDEPEPAAEVCRDFLKGMCNRTDCKYSHDAVAAAKDDVVGTKSAEVCRDFLKGLCGRTGCKFKHDASMRNTGSTPKAVCKDYQNGKCHRANCKFLHLMKEEAEEFEKTGILPDIKPPSKDPEICRDFQNGLCKRGNLCRFSHGGIAAGLGFGMTAGMNAGMNAGMTAGIHGKRPFSALSTSLLSPNMAMSAGSPQEINQQLKHKLLELRKQVLDLQQLNDVLYDENLKYRNQVSVDNPISAAKMMSLLPKPYATNGHGY